MLSISRNGSANDRLLRRTKPGRRAKRKRQYALESLEGRTLLTYTFTYGGVNGPQVVDETGGGDSFTVVNNGFGLLEWSETGAAGPFSTQWGALPADTLNASPAVSLTINLASDNSAVIDGTSLAATSSASAVQAHLHVNAAPGNLADSLDINDTQSPLGPGTYTLNGAAGTITGPFTDVNISLGIDSLGGGITLEGNDTANTYNVISTYSFGGIGEGVTIMGGAGDDIANVESTVSLAPANVDLAGGANTVNAGSAGSVAGISGDLSVTDALGTTTLNVDDSSDTTSATATLSGTTPYELTGLSTGAIEYGAGVTALNIMGGTFGGAGVIFDINATQAITTTTITGGANQNFFNLSNAGLSDGLDNLAGPVSVLGGPSFSDVVTLDDSSADFNDTYTVTDTTVTRGGPFGGLTYDDNIGTLTLNAENTLGTNGNNISTSTARPISSSPTSTARAASIRSTSTPPAFSACSTSRPALMRRHDQRHRR